MGNILRGFVPKAVLLIFGLFLLTATGYCAEGAEPAKDWSVPMFGVFKVPQEFQAAEVKGLKELVQQQKDNVRLKLDVSAKGDAFDRVDIAVYQLTMNDGQAYRQAWLLAVRDRQVTAQIGDLLTGPNPEEKIRAILLQDSMIRSLEKISYIDPKTGIGFKVLELSPLEFTSPGGTPVLAGGIRALVKNGDFLFPFFAKGYVFAVDKHLAGLFCITYDSERQYWNEVMGSIVDSMELKTN